MTAKKDLKRRIRERQKRTGENYVVARRAVVGEDAAARSGQEANTPPPPSSEEDPPRSRIDVVEMHDHTADAAALDLRCSVAVAGPLIEVADPRLVIRRFRDVILSAGSDPSMGSIRAVALRGEPPVRSPLSEGWHDEVMQFITRARAGIGGVSEGGTMLAFPVEGKQGLVMVICHLSFGIIRPGRNPCVVLTTAEASSLYIERIASRARR